MIPKQMKMVTIPLHVSAMLYAVVMVGAWLLISMVAQEEEFSRMEATAIQAIVALLCISLIVFIEVVVEALKKGTKWSWIAALVLTVLYIPSAFLPLGVFMLVGLLKPEVQDHCGVQVSL